MTYRSSAIRLLFWCLMSLFIINLLACNSKDNGISPVQHEKSPIMKDIVEGRGPWWGENIAASATIFSNASLSSNPPALANDGLLNTFWSGNYPNFASKKYSGIEFGLSWSHPQNIRCIRVHQGQGSFFTTAIKSIMYFDLFSGEWKQLFGYGSSGSGDTQNLYYDVFLYTKLNTTSIKLNFESFIASSAVIAEVEVHDDYINSLRIFSPKDGSVFSFGDPIFLSGGGVYHPTLPVVSNAKWLSSLDGEIASLPEMPYWDPTPTATVYLSPGLHTITLQGVDYNNAIVATSVKILVQDIDEIRIKNLDPQTGEDPFAPVTAVSYRAATTRFEAIGYRANIPIGPVPVVWEIQGGEVIASEQLRMGILSHLGQPNTRIGNIENSPIPVPSGGITPIIDSSHVTLHSFLPGNITLVAKKGTASASVSIRIKKPVFKVNVYPVGDVETAIFATWENITRQVWEKENVVKIESVTLMPAIQNVVFPAPPLAPPYQGAEASLTQFLYEQPNLLNPLVYDCLLGHTSSFFNVPRQSGILLASREHPAVNIYHVFQPWCYFVLDQFTLPPTKDWYPPEIYAISSRDHFVTLEVSGAIIESFFNPYPTQYSRFLAAGVGRVFGLVHAAEWLGNLMDFSPIGGLVLTPEQFITALNYRNDNPQNSTMIWEE